MKVVIIGASKGIGKQTVLAALKAGHIVTAFSRSPAVLQIEHPNLRLQQGDVLDTAVLKQAIAGQDLVVCALGLPTRQAIGPPFASRSFMLSAGTANILESMTADDVKRFICVTAIGSGESVKDCTPLARLTLRYGLRWLFLEKDKQEELIKNSTLDWTIIRPTALTNGSTKGAMLGEHVHAGILTHVSRAEVAETILDLANQKKTYGKALTLSYPARFGDSVRWVAGYFGKA